MTEWTPKEAKVLRTFVVDGRIQQLPARQGKRRVVYRWLIERIPADRWIAEVELNGILRPFHADVATIRRELYEFGFLEREGGSYRKSKTSHATDARPSHCSWPWGDESPRV